MSLCIWYSMISFITFLVCSLQILYFQHTHPVVSDFVVSAFKRNNSISFPFIMTYVVRGFLRLFFVCGGCSLLHGAASPVVASAGFSLQQLLLLRSTGSRLMGSGVVRHRFSCPITRGIFLDHGSNRCPLCCKTDS